MFDPVQFARQTVGAVEFGDQCAEALEERVLRLEEVAAARWPRSWLLRRQLARELRASVAGYDHIQGGFRARRLEAVGDRVLFESQERRQHRDAP